jgi:ATP-dependent RNA helicase DeaD
MTTEAVAGPMFSTLRLAAGVMQALDEVGYEHPTPIQARTIPPLLDGRDLLGQAQTGTGKTAAFALPLLSRIDIARREPQVLVLVPTRELAIQVAEAFQRYAVHLPGLHVLPIYGGQDYAVQLRMLSRGVHVVVGTPGRVMDHMRRATLKLDGLAALVLDEADEMLRMGFIDDVEHILGQAPPGRQLALFSATLPKEVQRIAHSHLVNPVEVRLEGRNRAAAGVRQRVWMVSGTHKLDALTRILEVESFDAMIVFVRTRIATVELAERLCARGFDAAAINGDLAQVQRERLIANLRAGELDILVATDVAARGLDVERVSHVVNFDIPYDAEAYVHRIGRTGRAGRNGDAILFVAPRERHMLRTIERATGQRIDVMELPSHEAIKDVRIRRFFDGLNRTLAEQDLDELTDLIRRFQQEHEVDTLQLAAALAHQTKAGAALLAKPRRPAGAEKSGAEARSSGAQAALGHKPERHRDTEAPEVELFRLEVGRDHGAAPGNIVGALINEAGLARQHVGRVEIAAEHSTVELPVGMPKEIFTHLQSVRVAGRRLNIARLAPVTAASSRNRNGRRGKPAKPRPGSRR